MKVGKQQFTVETPQIIDSNLTFTFWSLWRCRHTLHDFSQRSQHTLLPFGHNTQRNSRNGSFIPVHLGSNDRRGRRQ